MLKPLPRITLSQAIIEEIILTIKKGYWQLGEKIPSEQELATSFSVGRNSIREAIKALNNMRVLDSQPGKGTFISCNAMRHILSNELINKGYQNATLNEIIEIRNLLESQSAYWAAERATEADLAKLREILVISKKSDDDLALLNEVHERFHDVLIQLAGNSLVLRLLSSIEAEIDAQRSAFDHMSTVDISCLIKDQEEVIHFILDRKPKEARDSMAKHIEKGYSLIKRDYPDDSVNIRKVQEEGKCQS